MTAREKYLSILDYADLKKYSSQKNVLQENERPIICVYHDESTVYANAQQSSYWTDGTNTVLYQKSMGSAIMVSDFIDAVGGFLEIGDMKAQTTQHQKDGYFTNDHLLIICDLWWQHNKVSPASHGPRSQCGYRDHVTLLGFYIGAASDIQDTILKRAKSLQTLGSRLRAHDAFCLLHNALAIPKMLYILHTLPCFLILALHGFDSLLRSLRGIILNLNLTDSAWTQVSLPVQAGGLGVRSTTQLAPSAYLASAAGCAHLVQQILTQRPQSKEDSTATSAKHAALLKIPLADWKADGESLMKHSDTNGKFLPTIATACCVLQNIGEIHGDDFDEN